MLVKNITYTDYNGVERTEPFYFNLSKADVIDMEMGISGGLIEMLNRIIASKDSVAIYKTFKEIILKSYGEKSADGKRFIKKDERGRSLAESFIETEAFSVLMMEFFTTPGAAADFVKAIIPQDIPEVDKQLPASN